MEPVVLTEVRLNMDPATMAECNVYVDSVDLFESNPLKTDEVLSPKLTVLPEVKSEHSSCYGTLPEARRRKRNAEENNQMLASQLKRNKTEKKPTNSLRYDSNGHFPEFDKNDNATRCKNENCKFKTRLFCMKCNIHLCLTPSRNCFKSFHLLSTE